MLFRSGTITLLRWTRALQQVAQTGPLALRFLQRAVTRAVAEAGVPVAQARPLLELLREWVCASGEGISDARCRSFLETAEGSGKAAAVARALLAPAVGDPAPHRREAARRVLASRLERAERWTKIAD